VARLFFRVTLVLVGLASAPNARAESYNPGSVPQKKPPLIELGAEAFARYDNGNFCDADGDAVSCTSGRAFLGGAVVPRLRLFPLLSVGVLGAYALAPGSEGSVSSDGSHDERTLATYWFQAEGRLHPLYGENIHLWIAATAGVTALRDARDSYDANDAHTGTVANTDWGPMVGAGVGIDFHVLPFLTLGPVLRGAVLKYPDGDDTALNQNDSQFFVALGVTGTLLIQP
jgi:hypothetical protein